MGYVPKIILSADASPDGWPEKGRHIGGQKAEVPTSITNYVPEIKLMANVTKLHLKFHYIKKQG